MNYYIKRWSRTNPGFWKTSKFGFVSDRGIATHSRFRIIAQMICWFVKLIYKDNDIMVYSLLSQEKKLNMNKCFVVLKIWRVYRSDWSLQEYTEVWAVCDTEDLAYRMAAHEIGHQSNLMKDCPLRNEIRSLGNQKKYKELVEYWPEHYETTHIKFKIGSAPILTG